MTHSTAKPVPSARRLAYQALYDVLEKDAYSNIVLQRILAEYPLKAEEAHLLTELVYGVLRKYNYLSLDHREAFDAEGEKAVSFRADPSLSFPLSAALFDAHPRVGCGE